MEQQTKKSIDKYRQKSWAEYLSKQMEEKRRRAKIDRDLSLNYDSLMVNRDHLRVE